MGRNRQPDILDIFIIGGGINGCGIARDASGRGLNIALAEMNDLASATSSASTKLFHGGLRYLEYFEFRLVREALMEREVLLQNMPHISWPMRFVLPYHKDMRFEGNTPTSKLLSLFMPWLKGQRPSWLIRLGLFLYDHLGGRKILPGTKSIDLATDPAGKPLNSEFAKAFEYSDCWVEDARLVALNARDAAERGACILTGTQVVGANAKDGVWEIRLIDKATGQESIRYSRVLVNAAGPWVGDVLSGKLRQNTSQKVRLVRGSHIVTRKLFDHDKCYFFQGEDGRIVFAIPYENDFTLIGTTDQEHEGDPAEVACTPTEKAYLIEFISRYLIETVTDQDVVWTYSGVRPLYDDGASSATAATRDYVLTLSKSDEAVLLNVFGGKITTYRRLAESALEKLAPYLREAGESWTATAPLPGGDFKVEVFDSLVRELKSQHSFLDERWAKRLVRAYGTDASEIMNGASKISDLGKGFGASLTEAEVRWLIEKEFARTAEDVVWRRTKLGLRMSNDEIEKLGEWMRSAETPNGNSIAAE